MYPLGHHRLLFKLKVCKEFPGDVALGWPCLRDSLVYLWDGPMNGMGNGEDDVNGRGFLVVGQRDEIYCNYLEL